MIDRDEADRVALEIVDLLPSKLSQHDPESVDFVLSLVLYHIADLTEKSLGIKKALIFLEKHHRIVDALGEVYTARYLEGPNNESKQFDL